MRDRSDKFKFPRDDRLGKITFANKVWDNVNIVAFDHPENFSQARFFFPKAAKDFRKEPAANDFVRMLKGGRARIRIQGGAMTHQHQGALPFIRHVSKLDASSEFLKWNSRSVAPNRGARTARELVGGWEVRRSGEASRFASAVLGQNRGRFAYA